MVILGVQEILNIIQVHVPNADKSKDEIERFYDDIQHAPDITKSREVKAKIGKGKWRKFGRVCIGTKE